MLMISKFFGTKNHLAGMLAVVFLLSSGIFLQARESETQKTKINLDISGMTVKAVLEQIEDMSNYSFFYNNRHIDLARKIDISVRNADIFNVLDQIFTGTDVCYSVVENRIVLTKKPKEAETQQRTNVIRGTVLDEDGAPLVGAYVIIKGTNTGTFTDASGQYSIDAPANSVLVFSNIGFITQEVQVDNRNSVDIVLRLDTAHLDEVVVVGYGTQKKGEVASAISTVKSKDFQVTPSQNAAELIKGKVPGLTVNSPDGNPVSNTEISLRGATTLLASAAPLVLIDGIPGDLNQVSPDDIDQIDVLKDGSAAAIYGTRGTNGVIIITTKNAKGEMPTQVDFSAYVSTQTITKKLDYMTADEYRELAKGHVGYHDDGASVDWLDEITRTPLTQVYNISLRGGSKSTNYVASVEYRGMKGIIKKSNNTMIYPRIEITHRMFNNMLKINAGVNGFRQEFHNGSDGGSFDSAVYRNINYNPTTPVYDSEGNYSENTGITDYFNPVSLLNETKGKTQGTMLRTFANLTFTPINGLDINYLMSDNIHNYTQGHYETHKHSYNAREGKNGFASRGTYRGEQIMTELTAQYRGSFLDDHHYAAMIGYSWLKNNSQFYWMQNSTFSTDFFEYNNIGAGTAIDDGRKSGWADMSSNQTESKLVGYFTRLNYNYKEKYMLSGSFRREGSTKFGANNKWGNFWSASAAWNVKDEPFLKDVKEITALKLRVGYGETGTEPSSSYMSLNTLNTTTNIWYDGEWIQSISAAKNSNPNLKWERKQEWNLGLDFGLLNDRISGTIDLYNRKSLDLLWNYTVASPPNAFSSMTANAGKIRNRGIEIGITAIPVMTKDLQWTTSLNYSHNKNKVLTLSSDSFFSSGYSDEGNTGEPMQQSTHRLKEGQPIGNFWGFKSVDVDDEGHWLIEGEDGSIKSINDQQPTDKQILGNGIPKHYVNWSNNITWKNFDFSMLFRGAFDFEILNLTAMKYGVPVMLTRGNVLKSAFDKVYGKTVLADDQSCQYVSYYVEKGDYVKLDNITLGYTFNFMNKYVQNCRLYIALRNVATITDYSGIDPEVSVSGLTPGVDYYNRYPATRSYTFGISVRF